MHAEAAAVCATVVLTCLPWLFALHRQLTTLSDGAGLMPLWVLPKGRKVSFALNMAH